MFYFYYPGVDNTVQKIVQKIALSTKECKR